MYVCMYVCTNRLLSGVMVAVIRKKKKKSWECQGDVRIVGLFSLLLLGSQYDTFYVGRWKFWEVEEDGLCFRSWCCW